MVIREVFRFFLWRLATLIVLLALGFLWLYNSPYWDGISLFSDAIRAVKFREMDRIFSFREVARGESVWAFAHAPQPLPERYSFNGEGHDLAALLDRTETTGLLVVHRGAITHEEYRLGEDETSPLTS